MVVKSSYKPREDLDYGQEGRAVEASGFSEAGFQTGRLTADGEFEEEHSYILADSEEDGDVE